MEIFKHEQPKDFTQTRRFRIIHCLIHTALQVATLAVAVSTLHRVESMSETVSHLKRR